MSERDQVGRTLTDRAWQLILQVRSLDHVVSRGWAAALFCALVTIIGGAYLNGNDLSAGRRVASLTLIVGGAYLAALVVGYSSMVVVVAADRVMRGDEPDVPSARATVRRRLVSVAGWVLISSVATLALGFVRLVGYAGWAAGNVWAARWGLRTYFVAPVILLEGRGALAALRRSGQLMRERWGPRAIGSVAIGRGEATLAGFGVFFSFLGMGLVATPDVVWVKIIGTVILIVTVSFAVVGGALCGATRAVFGVALYRYVAEQRVLDRFSANELEGVVQVSQA